MRRTQQRFCESPAKNAQTESNQEETSDKWVRGINQRSWPRVFKSVNVLKVKKRLGICSRLKELWETMAMKCDPRLDPFTVKITSGAAGKT